MTKGQSGSGSGAGFTTLRFKIIRIYALFVYNI
jgi:hypothetical protein